MKPTELLNWVTMAKDAGADRIEVRRARRNGTATKQANLFHRAALDDTFEVDALVVRMRDDVVARRIPTATFDVFAMRVATKDDGKKGDDVTVAQDRVTVAVDDEASDLEGLALDASDNAVIRYFLAAQERSNRLIVDMSREYCQGANANAAALADRMVSMQGKMDETLESAFQLATLRFESQKEENASSERREVFKHGITEFAPILGSISAEIVKRATPAWAGLFKSLGADPARFQRIVEMMTPEEQATLFTALGITFPTQSKGEKVDEPVVTPPPAEKEGSK